MIASLLTVVSRYNPSPSLSELVTGIRLAQMWNVPRLFHYSLDHFKRQFSTKAIHPMIVLAVARENGIPSLIKPAVEALAESRISLYSWCSDNTILQYTRVEEVSAIARLKERLYLARLSILDIPPAIHGKGCVNAVGCRVCWERYWGVEVAKRVRKLVDGAISNELWLIRSDILKAEVPGMGRSCLTATVDKVGTHHCWYVDRGIIEGAVECLLVDERIPDWRGTGSDD